jgi:cobaltochelatase CobT
MLKEGLLKENIDGEALLFAKARLMQQPEQRKILVVISDGNPVDDSTNSANGYDILSWHLQQVIWQIEKQKKIELIGIGIGHDLQRFYKNSITIDNPQDLGNVLITKISAAL